MRREEIHLTLHLYKGSLRTSYWPSRRPSSRRTSSTTPPSKARCQIWIRQASFYHPNLKSSPNSGFFPPSQLSFCFWLSTDDGDNYGTPLSYATAEEDNELTLTDYSGFVLAVAGRKVVTDVAANSGEWTAICVSWYEQLNACLALEF